MEPVARRFLGEPNKALSTPKVLRWGTNGSMAVDVVKGVFFNNETKAGGGVLVFVEVQSLVDQAGAWLWLRQEYPNHFPVEAAGKKANGHDKGGSHIVKAYPYLDADGALLFEVCRKQPKAFVQRRPDGKGGFIWSTKGVKQVPYRLPELIEDIAMERQVWITEGERDVDTLRAAGLPATTNAGGAGKWRAELNPWFKDADVVIVADHDEAGRDHAHAVAAQLAAGARRVRVLDLGKVWSECPPKGDCSDFLAGRPIAELQALAAELPDPGVEAPFVLPRSRIVASLAGKEPPPRLWHVPDLVPARTVTLLGGDGGVGKSIVGLQLAFATAISLMWVGQLVRGGKALHLSAEDDDDELHRRVDAISKFYGVPLEDVTGLTLWSLADEDAVLVNGKSGEQIVTTGRWQELQRFVELERPALIVLDSLADVYGANENERPQVRQFVRMLRGLVMPFDGAVVLLGHPSVAGLQSGSGLSGSTAWNNSVRSRMFMSAPEAEEGGESEPNLRTLAVKKANYAQAGSELRIRYVAGAFEIDGGAGTSALDRQVQAGQAEELFLRLLDGFKTEGRMVSHNTGRGYAPALFAADPRAVGTTSKGFAAAMNRLFAAGRIRVAHWGPASRRVSFIERV